MEEIEPLTAHATEERYAAPQHGGVHAAGSGQATSGEEESAPHTTCPHCGSSGGQWRGYRMREKGGVVHRRACNGCGKWFFAKIGRAR